MVEFWPDAFPPADNRRHLVEKKTTCGSESAELAFVPDVSPPAEFNLALMEPSVNGCQPSLTSVIT
jgi:hypothetical protein